VAQAYWAGRDSGLPNGILLAVPNRDPVVSEEDGDGDLVEKAILESLDEAERRGIAGRDVTPFLLKRVAMRTGGASLRSNIALVKRNATVGVAQELRRWINDQCIFFCSFSICNRLFCIFDTFSEPNMVEKYIVYLPFPIYNG